MTMVILKDARIQNTNRLLKPKKAIYCDQYKRVLMPLNMFEFTYSKSREMKITSSKIVLIIIEP